MTNALADAIRARRFCYVVELVASGLKREAQVLEIASSLARVPHIVAGSVTSYAGGRFGQDSVRVGTAVRARGLTPNVHLTCVSQSRATLQATLKTLKALEILNVFALTGDFPTDGQTTPVFDLDSVQLTQLIARLRTDEQTPFHIAVAVSPFKYAREDCLYQYLKLEKKVEAGADLAITQVGWDSRKLVELKRYLDERRLAIPVLGNVYVLSRRAAERMAGGLPPGCWASPELVHEVSRESESPDHGLGARLERAAKTVAVLKGLGYAGAYIGGTHDASHVASIIARAEQLESEWERCAAELRFGPASGFYLYDGHTPPRRRLPVVPRALDRISRLIPVTKDTWLRRRLVAVFAWIDRHPICRQLVERLEHVIKRPAFGCEACGNCVLGHLEYVCPQTCPKQMRNGPCGGTFLGRCEVVDRPCIWVTVYQHAEAAGRVDDLKAIIPAPNRALAGTSSWINYFLGRDTRPTIEPSENKPTRALPPVSVSSNS